MQVETFECSETKEETPAMTEEAKALIEELGMEGQKALVTPNTSGDDKRCPYRMMTRDEWFTYGVLCPEVYELKSYAASTVPLRVLQVAAHAKSLGFFKKIVVWDRASAEVVDPVLVGMTHDSSSRYDPKGCYILARWGETLETFPTLLKQALAEKRARLESDLRKILGIVQAAIAGGHEDAYMIQHGPAHNHFFHV